MSSTVFDARGRIVRVELHDGQITLKYYGDDGEVATNPPKPGNPSPSPADNGSQDQSPHDPDEPFLAGA